MAEMTINGIDVEVYNARLLNYSVSGTTVTNNTLAAANTLKMPLLLSTTPSTRTLTVSLVFFPHRIGENSRNTSIPDRLSMAAENITRFEGLLVGKTVEISLPDGFMYTAIVQSLPAAVFDSDGEHEVTYTFLAIRHKATVTQKVVSGGAVFCESNTTTPCIISATFNTVGGTPAIPKVTLQGITVRNISAGTNIIIDGVNGFIMADNNNKFNDSDLINFPMLQPGKNIITSTPDDADITVTYIPLYI